MPGQPAVATAVCSSGPAVCLVGTMRVGGNKKGAFTRDRQPKTAAHQLRERWTGERSPVHKFR